MLALPAFSRQLTVGATKLFPAA
uniref:Uncharacterized protein n=1 Tax=Anguilla anguilla TaxID=7936 RepID=A0A0E9RG08_ANGAN